MFARHVGMQGAPMRLRGVSVGWVKISRVCLCVAVVKEHCIPGL